MLVGRERDLESLDRHLDDCEAGRGRVVLLVGEAGLGKSTLLEATLERARARGWLTAIGRAWEMGGAPPCWPWSEAMRTLAADPRLGAIDLRARPGLEALCDLDSASPPVLDAAQARFRMFEAAARAIADAAAVAPLAIGLDDLHAADATSLALLHFVAQRAPSTRVLILGTLRDHERLAPEIAALLTRISRSAEELRPARLGADDVARLALEAGADAAVAARIAELTDGLPLFVVEYLRLVQGRGAAGALDAPPRNVIATLEARVAALTPATRTVLELASVAGRSVDRTTLLALGATDVDAALAEAGELALLDRDGDCIRLSHALVCDLLRLRMPDATRRAAHLALAARATDPSEATHHLLAAGAWTEAALAAERGAERAHRVGADDDAVAILEGAIALFPVTAELTATRARLLVRASEMLAHAGRTERSETLALEAAELARGLGDAELVALAALALGAKIRPGERRAALISLLEEARVRLPAEQIALHARVSARLAGALQPHPEPGVPVAMALEAISRARRTGDREALLDALHHGGSALVSFGEPAVRVPLDTELLELASLLDRPAVRLRALLRLVFSSLERGDRAAAESFAEAHAELARTHGRTEHAFHVLALRAMFATGDGRFEDARALQEEMQLLTSGQDGLGRVLAQQRLGLARASGDDETALALEPPLRAIGAAMHPVYPEFFSMAIASRRRDVTRCTELASRMWVDARCLEEADWMAETARTAGAADTGVQIAALIRPHAAFATFSAPTSFVIEPPATRTIGVALTAAGQLDEAEAMLASAEQTSRSMRLPAIRALILEDRALVAHARAAAADARGLRGEALELARELGITGMVRRLTEQREPVVSNGARASGAVSRFSLTGVTDGFRLESPRASAHLRASRGLEMIARLIERPGEEIDALALDGGTEGVDAGDSGELLDARAISAYRARVTSLRERIARREDAGDRDGAEELREELDAIARELARGTGLGGRARRAGAAAERARVNVQRRIRAAIEQIGDVDEELACHLREAIRTGARCAYAPGSLPTS